MKRIETDARDDALISARKALLRVSEIAEVPEYLRRYAQQVAGEALSVLGPNAQAVALYEDTAQEIKSNV